MDDQRNNQDAETLYTGLPAIDDLPAIYRYLNEEKARYVIIGRGISILDGRRALLRELHRTRVGAGSERRDFSDLHYSSPDN